MKDKNTKTQKSRTLSLPSRFFLRVFDLLAGVVLYVLLAWLALILIAVKWFEGFYSPIYISKRIGKYGKEFYLVKINTLCPQAEELKQQLIDAGLNEVECGFKMADDPRVTKIGRVYAKYYLDRILSLQNVIAGHISILDLFSPEYNY